MGKSRMLKTLNEIHKTRVEQYKLTILTLDKLTKLLPIISDTVNSKIQGIKTAIGEELKKDSKKYNVNLEAISIKTIQELVVKEELKSEIENNFLIKLLAEKSKIEETKYYNITEEQVLDEIEELHSSLKGNYKWINDNNMHAELHEDKKQQDKQVDGKRLSDLTQYHKPLRRDESCTNFFAKNKNNIIKDVSYKNLYDKNNNNNSLAGNGDRILVKNSSGRNLAKSNSCKSFISNHTDSCLSSCCSGCCY